MSLFFGDFPTEDTVQPTVMGGSAGLNSAMFFTCPACASCVVEMGLQTLNRLAHEEWHDAQDAKIAKAAKTAGRPTKGRV